MVQVNLVLIGRGFHQAVQEIPAEKATKIVQDPDNAADKYRVEKILTDKTPSDRDLRTLGHLWLQSYATTKEDINGYLTRCGLQSVDYVIWKQEQSLQS